MSGSVVFRRNRALGYVANHIPATVKYMKGRKINIIVTCIGRSLHAYECKHFRLISVGRIHPEDITCISSDNRYVYSASAGKIFAWRAGNQLFHTYTGHGGNVHLLLPFGQHLVAVDEANVVRVWDIEGESVYLEIPFAAEPFRITAVTHPATYINKILFGSEQGLLQLWNIKSGKLIHTFQSLQSRVVVLEQAPAVDVVAVGLQNGDIKLLNLKFDEILMEFRQDWGPVTGISFRTDGHPIMITSSTNGEVVSWDLEKKKIANQLTAHTQSVVTLKCLPSEPLFVSTSPDNSLKMWIFDMPDGGARLLRFREGHAAPPLCVRFHGATGGNILSAGEDSSLRVFNTITEKINRSLGRASYNRKAVKKNRKYEDVHLMAPIVQFTSEVTREKEWDSIAAIHSGLDLVTTWSYHSCKMGELKLRPKALDEQHRQRLLQVEATCICLTNCGNFVVVGYSSGDVQRFNVQSGLHRATYGAPAHETAVRGVAVDALNQIRMEDGLTMFRAHRESGMICIPLENFILNILDCETKVVVRKFSGHRGPITDCCFSPDSRWLISASLDGTIKVWDIPSAYLIDHFKLEVACVSLTMSPTGDFLATAHIDHLGIFLWTNKTLFDHVSLRALNPTSEAPPVDLPAATEGADVAQLDEEFARALDLGEEITITYETPHQLDSSLITMSTATSNRWQNIFHLDLLKKRAKPRAPVKTEKNAPFFLPTIPGLEFKFDLSAAANPSEGSKVIIPKDFSNFTTFGKILNDTAGGSFQPAIEHIVKLGPSMVNFEIKSLSPDAAGSIELMHSFLAMLHEMLESNVNFELAQSFLAVFLREHADTVTQSEPLRTMLDSLMEAQERGWRKIEQKLLYGLGVFTSEVTREKEWDSIAAIHSGLDLVTTWSYHSCKMGELKLRPKALDERHRQRLLQVEATCICLTNCGNFVVVGYSSGDVQRFNVQSGLHRATYGAPAHETAVRGVAVDALNQIRMEDGLTMFRAHRESGMICIPLENFILNILDCETKVVVRKFSGHRGPITDCCFSPDSRWLISASLDGTIKVWDIPSAYLIDHFKLEVACVSLTMSPTGDFLATAHIDHLGIFLWTNKTLFDHISLRALNPTSEAPPVDLPAATEGADVAQLDEEFARALDLGEEITITYETPHQLDSSLITMSTATSNRWQNIFHLDLLKKRAKPRAPVQTEKNAPFFLPTIPGLEFKFDLSAAANPSEGSKVIIPKDFSNFTTFGKILNDTAGGSFQPAIEHIVKLGPSMVNFEIKSLSPDAAGSIELMHSFLAMLHECWSRINRLEVGILLEESLNLRVVPFNLLLASIELFREELLLVF
uniref:Putative wd repeat protein n=1 Tax=Lutzomyia longipalpis TaxID=7200 RepID=A0A7G3B8J2_LUTLO